MKLTQKILATTILGLSVAATAAPMPNTIVVQDKAVVPILKTEVIRRVEGQQPQRTVEATIFEVTNKGQDIVAREVEFQDDLNQFSDKKLATPVIQKGGVIVPTSKIEINSTLKSNGEIVGQSKQVDAAGVEFKKDEKPVKRTLQLDQVKNPKNESKVSRAVVGKNGVVTKDIVVVEKGE